ncbi:hypothetical protein Nepgr_025313 [Nepenthes gracilis]|uniref:Uncharacterized protein n=1 Tax=Nepenthes gracilis TaxID=150966 RepID=A0AAD3T5P5_NEPGR|nr:hypothetical protein Nepgr_025313 [Nepenthes gracilis]
MCVAEQLNSPLDLEATQGTVNEMLPSVTCVPGENCQMYTRPLLFIRQLLHFWKALLHSCLANRILFLIISQSPNVATRRSSIWDCLSGAIYRGANIGIPQRKLQWEWNISEKTLMVLDDMCLSYERKLLKNIEVVASFWYPTLGQKPFPTPTNVTVFAILIKPLGQQLCSLVEIAWLGDQYSSYLEMYATRHGALRALTLYWSNEGNINKRKHVLMPQREQALLTEWEDTTD